MLIIRHLTCYTKCYKFFSSVTLLIDNGLKCYINVNGVWTEGNKENKGREEWPQKSAKNTNRTCGATGFKISKNGQIRSGILQKETKETKKFGATRSVLPRFKRARPQRPDSRVPLHGSRGGTWGFLLSVVPPWLLRVSLVAGFQPL